MPTVRTFIAIPLPQTIQSRVIEHVTRLQADFPGVRASWVRAQNLHLTLKFLGNVALGDVARISAATELATRSVPPVSVSVSGCGSFPARGRPNVLWIGVQDETGRLNQLHSRLEQECERAGFARDDRGFNPHLTIARLRGSDGTRELGELHKRIGFPPVSFSAAEVVVFRSELHPNGSRHSVISSHRPAVDGSAG